MGIGDFINSVGNAIGDGIDEAETKAGSILDKGAHTVATWVRDAGAGGVADAIDHIGDQIADVLGGELTEMELGQTKDKTELIRGEPDAINDVVGKLHKMSASIESTGDALKTIDVADWTGKGASAFHTAFDKQPKLWWTAGDAMSKTAAHLSNWYWAVETAQAKAQDAIDKWEAADKEESTKKSAWNALSDKDKKAHPLADTWTSMRDDARAILKNARSQRDSIANQIASGISAETQQAPTEPPLTQRLSDDFDDMKDIYEYGKISFGDGLLTSFSSIVQFARSTNVLDPYNITHPAAYVSHMADLGTGMVTAAADPGAVVHSMLSDARRNPFEAGGALTGNIILTIATGGAGGAAKTSVEALDEINNAARIAKTTSGVAEDLPGLVPGRSVPRVDAPAIPDRAAPSPGQTLDTRAGSGAPADARAGSGGPADTRSGPAPADSRAGAGTPADAKAGAGAPADGKATPGPADARAGSGTPADTRAGSAAPSDAAQPGQQPPGLHPDSGSPAGPSNAPEGGPAAGPHPDGAAPQANPVAEPRPVDTAPEHPSTAPHADQPVAANDHVPGDNSPHSGPDTLRSEPDTVKPHPEADPAAPHQDKPGDTRPEHPNDQTQPGAHPAADTAPRTEPTTPHHEPDGTHSGDRPSPDHTTPDHENPAADTHPGHDQPDPHGHEPTLDDLAHNDADARPHHSATDAPAESNRTPDNTCAGRDPVDIATGEFLLPETDLELPGILALVLKRRHRSNYRFGRWFGPSWSATLDMRIVVEDEGVTFLGEDGLLIAYPHPEPGIPVESLTGGTPWTLTRTDSGGYQVRDPQRELLWHFAPNTNFDGLDVQLGNFAVSALTDRHLNRIRFHYGVDGAPTAITHSGGYRVEIATAAGRITELTVIGVDGSGAETRTPIRQFGYQAGNLAAVTNAVAATTTYTYDDRARMLSWTDSNGTSLRNVYDESGRVIRQHGTDGILDSAFEYLSFPDGTGTFTTVTDSLGAATQHGFDHDLRLRDIVDPVGGHTHYDYNRDRHPLKVVAADGATTEYRYTSDGDLTQLIRPDGASITMEYGARSRPSTITDADGSVRHQEWDGAGNLVATTDAAGIRTEYTYHANGAVASVLAATGARSVVEVNAAGLPVTVADPYGATTRIDRDNFGRPIRVTDPLGGLTLYSWSPSGKLLSRNDPDGFAELWTWDNEGNLLTHTDRAGGITRHSYTAFDLLETRTDPDGSTTHYTWDTERRLTRVRNPLGDSWVYEYDSAGRTIGETDYAGATTRYAHDVVGRVASVTAADGTTRSHVHDILGRVTEVAVDSGEWRRYRHDRLGRVLTAVSGLGEKSIHTLQYDFAVGGQVLSQRLDDQPVLVHEYDPYGRRVRRTTPSGAVTTWHWDITGRVQTMSSDDQHIQFAHDRMGRQTGWRVGEITVDRELSGTGLLTAQQVTGFPASSLNLDLHSAARPSPTSIRRDVYAYRPDGYLTSHSLERLSVPSEQRSFALDPAGRVTAITRNDMLIESYHYDPLSNITDGHRATQAARFDQAAGASEPADISQGSGNGPQREYQRNLLIRDGRTRYHYDVSGRLIRKTSTRISRKPQVWHYSYDAFSQLIAVDTPDGSRWCYSYDAFGRRVTKNREDPDGTIADRVEYTWDDTSIIEQSGVGSVMRWQYQPNSYTPITQVTDQEDIDRAFFAIITDLVGAPVELIEPVNAEIAGVAAADLWGETVWHGGADTPLRFPGQIHDPETGLHYNLYRVYDPATGRYLTSDPLGLAPAANPNSYPHNPTVWTDPLGLCPEDVRDTYRGDSQNSPGGRHGPGVSIDHVKMELGRAGMPVNQYDIVHVPTIRTPDGVAYGNSPHTFDGLPATGPRGLPKIEISDIGLRNLNEAVATIYHEIYHHRQFGLTRNSGNIWGGSEAAAEDFGQRMLSEFLKRRAK
ncbi:putative T7SS-secreted protein [Nocardia sp. NBC_00511]|uniref:putative T7SS-secreted protein n=1 Tax=Nocardia sp. NBC_00511 TaxID=2903591 RepID=UPI0030E1407E